MSVSRLSIVVVALGTVGSACSGSDAPGAPGAGGATAVAGSTQAGAPSAAGATSGASGVAGSAGATSGAGGSGPVGAAGASTGGTASNGGTAGSGQSGVGGRGGAAGSSTSGGSAGMAGAGGSTGGAIPLKNPPVASAGCGKASTVTTGKKTITSSGEQRTYIIDIPANYDMNEPHRHVCYDAIGCRAEYPTKVCTFGGGHTNQANDPGSSTNWIPVESWKFFTRF